MLTVEQLKASGAIYLEHIQEGFEKYNYNIVSWNQEEACEHIRELWLLNGSEHSFADFYYYKLNNEAKEKVDSMLNEEEFNYIKGISNSLEEIIFPLDEILINILVKLNYSEMLFSTFYFTKEPSTLWGNYHGEYVVFQPK